MAQALRGLRWRAAWLVAGAVLVVLLRVAGGSPDGHVILIEFAMVPELEGARVLIDGEEAGTLGKRGARTLTGFRVEEGRHLVQTGLADCPGEPLLVTTGFGAGRVVLLADVEDRWAGGERSCRVVLRP